MHCTKKCKRLSLNCKVFLLFSSGFCYNVRPKETCEAFESKKCDIIVLRKKICTDIGKYF